MNGGQMMVVLIVAIVMIASIVKARYSHRHRPIEGAGEIPGDNRENQRLREEVTALKDRLAVLERITIEKENSLEREIEQLRDR
jgi:uncharacterized protein YlxW (UPF0749 family)